MPLHLRNSQWSLHWPLQYSSWDCQWLLSPPFNNTIQCKLMAFTPPHAHQYYMEAILIGVFIWDPTPIYLSLWTWNVQNAGVRGGLYISGCTGFNEVICPESVHNIFELGSGKAVPGSVSWQLPSQGFPSGINKTTNCSNCPMNLYWLLQSLLSQSLIIMTMSFPKNGDAPSTATPVGAGYHPQNFLCWKSSECYVTSV